MKHSVLVLTAVTLTLILRCHAQIDCNSAPANKKNIKAYSDKCLANGFPTKIAGCVTIGSNTLSGIRAKSCRKLHQRINACALNCLKAGADGVLSTTEVENIASKGMAKQSDTSGYGRAEKAIDGNNNGNYHSGSVTHTEASGSNAWWSLTYPRSMFIKEIQIFGRTDCCSERIDGASVLIDGKKVGTLNHNDGAPMVVPVNRVGSEIMIRNKEGGAQLSLAEVLVMGAKIESDPCKDGCDNIASEGLATQIDTDHNGEASRAIDGNTSNRWGSNSITHTKTTGPNAWWRLTFPENAYMEQIKVYGREDCCADRLDNATVYVDGELVGIVNSKIGFPNLINIAVSGQVIEIRPAGRHPLCLAEVEVIGMLMQ